jgi:hypothetical protein
VDTIHFTGHVLPRRTVDVDIEFPELEWDISESGLPYKIGLKLKIRNSNISLHVITPHYDDRQLDTYYVYAIRILQTATGMVSFSSGMALIPVIEKIIKPDGSIARLLIRDHRLQCTSFAIGSAEFGNILPVVMSDANIMMAMYDLSESIRVPDIGIVNCARVMDRIKHAISPNDKLSDSKKWGVMQDKLNISEKYLKEITDTSRNPRHGRLGRIDGPQTEKVLSRSWIIMDRFLHYKRRGDIKLPVSEFPMLS